jgi:DNA-directed RNA polymerase specialized sigma24 family protein
MFWSTRGRIGRLWEKGNPAGWLYRVGQSRSRRYRRRRVLFPAVEANPIPDVGPGLPAQLEALSVKQQQAVLMEPL